MRAGLALVCAGMCALVADARRADACTVIGPERHALDPTQSDDVTPPSAIMNVTYEVFRTDGGACSGNTDADCGGHGSIGLDFEATDDRTADGDLAYEVRAISGDDDRITILQGAWVYLEDNHVSISFAHEGQDLDLEVEIVAVDRNGNRSAPVRVHIVDNEAFGCSLGGARAGHTTGVLIVVASLIALRARRGRKRIEP